MGMIDMLLPKDQVAKATEALKAAETERRERIRKELDASGVANNNELVERLFAASSQAPSLRVAANATGKGALAEILNKVAEKLEGR
jgi:hypothetical protein